MWTKLFSKMSLLLEVSNDEIRIMTIVCLFWPIQILLYTLAPNNSVKLKKICELKCDFNRSGGFTSNKKHAQRQSQLSKEKLQYSTVTNHSSGSMGWRDSPPSYPCENKSRKKMTTKSAAQIPYLSTSLPYRVSGSATVPF